MSHDGCVVRLTFLTKIWPQNGSRLCDQSLRNIYISMAYFSRSILMVLMCRIPLRGNGWYLQIGARIQVTYFYLIEILHRISTRHHLRHNCIYTSFSPHNLKEIMGIGNDQNTAWLCNLCYRTWHEKDGKIRESDPGNRCTYNLYHRGLTRYLKFNGSIY